MLSKGRIPESVLGPKPWGISREKVRKIPLPRSNGSSKGRVLCNPDADSKS